MVILSDELVNVLLQTGYHDALCKQFRFSLIESEWYILGRALARAVEFECSIDELEEFLYEDFN
jgi:hypothetical protein